MSSFRDHLVLLPLNRVWRTYQGGRVLESLAGSTHPSDSHFPEDWIASTTRAVNIGRESVAEGVSQVEVAGTRHDFVALIKSDPAYFLGASHVAKYGCDPRLLVKFLDSSIRLHFQVHPTAQFAQRFLNSPSGKTEAYHVLAIRPDVAEPYIYLGFQRPPSREQLRRMIEEQDIAGLENCFDKVPVKPGDTYLVPGGVPHALGEGVFLVEIQEPSDLVVRFEFERGGYVLPESARFMNRGLEFCLDIFDLTPRPLQQVLTQQRCLPTRLETWGNQGWRDLLIGPDKTPCFSVTKTVLQGTVTQTPSKACIAIVTEGEVSVQSAGGKQHLRRYDKVFIPAGIGELVLTPNSHVEILECLPPS